MCCAECGKRYEVDLRCNMREEGNGTWRAVKEYSDMMFREEEITPLVNERELELTQDEQIYLRSKRVELLHEPVYPNLEKEGDGILYLTDRRLIFENEDSGDITSYTFELIRGRSTERNNIFQVILEDDIARFIMSKESCYKWEVVYDHIRRRGGYKDDEY